MGSGTRCSGLSHSLPHARNPPPIYMTMILACQHIWLPFYNIDRQTVYSIKHIVLHIMKIQMEGQETATIKTKIVAIVAATF